MADNAQALWRVIALADYCGPPQPAADRVRSSFSAWLARLMPLGDEAADAQEELGAPDPDLLERVTPSLDRDEVFAALDAALDASSADAGAVRAIVTPPHGMLTPLLADWALANGYATLDAPSTDDILAGDPAFLEPLFAGGRPFLIPHLERWFIRDASGLAIVRALIERLLKTSVRGLVGCDSGAWRFLARIAPVELLRPLTLAPLDGAALNRWLARPALRYAEPLRFRQADNGCAVLVAPDAAAEAVRSNYLERLAAHAEGIPGVALACWRGSLRIAPDPENRAGDEGPEAEGRTLWVRPWREQDWPSMPTQADKSDLFVLHAILLHGGLPANLMSRITALPATEVAWSLQVLGRAGLIEERQGRWQTTALGYPAVCWLLRAEGFLPEPG